MGTHGSAAGTRAMEPGLQSVATFSDKPKRQQADKPPTSTSTDCPACSPSLLALNTPQSLQWPKHGELCPASVMQPVHGHREHPKCLCSVPEWLLDGCSEGWTDPNPNRDGQTRTLSTLGNLKYFFQEKINQWGRTPPGRWPCVVSSRVQQNTKSSLLAADARPRLQNHFCSCNCTTFSNILPCQNS